MTDTVRNTVKRNIWSKILGKTSVKELVNKCGYFKQLTMFNRKPLQIINNRSYNQSGVSTGV